MEEFLKEVNKILITENECRVAKLNVPYMVSVLYQNLSDKKYSDFIKDISENKYHLYYVEDDSENWTNGYLEVAISGKDHGCRISHIYKIEFGKESRPWGYCQCTPEDEDYRYDKDCCGHGCDWTAPTFEIKKIISIGKDSWNGDQHDYWDFEDNFYKINEELGKEKLNKEKENRIQELHNTIKEMQEELLELEYEGE
jgi:hypothetical protein